MKLKDDNGKTYEVAEIDEQLYRRKGTDGEGWDIYEPVTHRLAESGKTIWRLLEVGEVIQEGDEFYNSIENKWIGVMEGCSLGTKFTTNNPHRRRVKLPENGGAATRIENRSLGWQAAKIDDLEIRG
jgi:hypothetical protein